MVIGLCVLDKQLQELGDDRMNEETMFPDMLPREIRRELITALTWPHLKAEQKKDKSKVYYNLTARKIVRMAEGDLEPSKKFLQWVRIESKRYAEDLIENNDDLRSKDYRKRMHDMIMKWRKELSE